MFLNCFKLSKKTTEIKNPKIIRTKITKLILLLCAVLKIIQEQEANH